MQPCVHCLANSIIARLVIHFPRKMFEYAVVHNYSKIIHTMYSGIHTQLHVSCMWYKNYGIKQLLIMSYNYSCSIKLLACMFACIYSYVYSCTLSWHYPKNCPRILLSLQTIFSQYNRTCNHASSDKLSPRTKFMPAAVNCICTAWFLLLCGLD